MPKGKKVAISAPETVVRHSDEVASRALRALLGEASTSETATQEGARVTRKRKRARGKQTAQTDSAGHGALADAASKPTRAFSTQVKSSERKRQRNAEEPDHVEGVFVSDELYLRDPATQNVYSSLRDKRGRLQHVGVWDARANNIAFVALGAAPKGTASPGKGEGQPIDEQPIVTAAIERGPGTTRHRPHLPDRMDFAADPEDHCETAPLAYKDVQPLLLRLCHELGKTPEQLRIYDPYFCAGSVVAHLHELGFPNVYNRNEDFYAAIERSTLPPHDVLLTNPPYSSDHIERLLAFCSKHDKPWLLLVPSYVHQKAYFEQLTPSPRQRPFFVVPKKRYNYWTPKGAGRGNPKVRKDGRTSPFVTLWHVNCQDANVKLLRWWQAQGHKQSPNARVYRDVRSIPCKLLDGRAPDHKRSLVKPRPSRSL